LISAFASPASRDVAVVNLHNDRSERLRFYPVVRQTSPLARTYLEHAWVDLDPDEERRVAVFTEFVTGDETMMEYVDEQGGLGQAFEQPNVLQLTGVAGEACSGATLGGPSLLVRTGQATEFRRFEVGEGAQNAFGRVVEVGTDKGVFGEVLVSTQSLDEPGREIVHTAEVFDGDFGIELRPELFGTLNIQAHYLGQHGIAPCESWIVSRTRSRCARSSPPGGRPSRSVLARRPWPVPSPSPTDPQLTSPDSSPPRGTGFPSRRRADPASRVSLLTRLTPPRRGGGRQVPRP
jgi:hypothetical protein